MAGLLFPLLLLAVMYFFLIVPQRKKQKAQQDLLSTLGPGDEVITSGGIYGGITEIDGEDLYLEIAPEIEIKVTKRAIANRTYRATNPAANPAGAVKPAVPEPYHAEGDEDEPTDKNKK
jgi:preprotein translocase subunit YajC